MSHLLPLPDDVIRKIDEYVHELKTSELMEQLQHIHKYTTFQPTHTFSFGTFRDISIGRHMYRSPDTTKLQYSVVYQCPSHCPDVLYVTGEMRTPSANYVSTISTVRERNIYLTFTNMSKQCLRDFAVENRYRTCPSWTKAKIINVLMTTSD